MTGWKLFSGTFTNEFAEVFRDLRPTEYSWEHNWTGGATENSGRKADPIGYRDTRYSEGVEWFVFDGEALSHRGTITGDAVNPQYLTMHPTLPILYATEYSPRGRLLAVALNPDGSHERRGAVDTLGTLAIAASIHPSGKHAYVAHWGDGTLTAVALNEWGCPLFSRVVVLGDADPQSKNSSRHHQIRFTPKGGALLVTDVGRDEITVYACDANGKVDPASIAHIEFPPLSAPCHMEFHPSGRWVYVVTEGASSLYLLEAEDGVPTRIVETYSTVPSDFRGINRPSELQLHPSGRFLYVGNRGFDSITIFSVTEMGGVEAIGHQPSFGRNLSCLKVDPTGQYLVAGNVAPGNVVLFRIGDDGKPYPVGEQLESPAPRSLAFWPNLNVVNCVDQGNLPDVHHYLTTARSSDKQHLTWDGGESSTLTPARLMEGT